MFLILVRLSLLPSEFSVFLYWSTINYIRADVIKIHDVAGSWCENFKVALPPILSSLPSYLACQDKTW